MDAAVRPAVSPSVPCSWPASRPASWGMAQQHVQHLVGGDEPTADHLVPGLPRVEFNPCPPAGLVVARDAVGVERVGDVLTGQVLAAHDAGAGLLHDLPDQRLLDRLAVLDGAAGKAPLSAVPGDHHHHALSGETEPECLGHKARRWHPSGCHQGEPAGPKHLLNLDGKRGHGRVHRAVRFGQRRIRVAVRNGSPPLCGGLAAVHRSSGPSTLAGWWRPPGCWPGRPARSVPRRRAPTPRWARSQPPAGGRAAGWPSRPGRPDRRG